MLIECPECGKEVSHQARACPNCGFGVCGPTPYIKTECHNYTVPEGYVLVKTEPAVQTKTELHDYIMPEGYVLIKKEEPITTGQWVGGCFVTIVVIIIIIACIVHCCS